VVVVVMVAVVLCGLSRAQIVDTIRGGGAV